MVKIAMAKYEGHEEAVAKEFNAIDLKQMQAAKPSETTDEAAEQKELEALLNASDESQGRHANASTGAVQEQPQ